MRQKAILIGLVVLITTIMAAITALPTSAKPDYSGTCGSCHLADTSVGASVTEAASTGGSTTYSFSISGPYSGKTGFGVFNSAGTKVASGTQPSGSFTVANGDTYTFYGVNKDPGGMQGSTSRSLSPTALPTPTTTTPPTTGVVTPTATVTPTQPVTKSREIEGILQIIAGQIWTVNGITVTVPTSITGIIPTVGAEVELVVILGPDGRLVAKKIEVEEADDVHDDEEKRKEHEDKSKVKDGSEKNKGRDDREDEERDAHFVKGRDAHAAAPTGTGKPEQRERHAEKGDKDEHGETGQAEARGDKGKAEKRDSHDNRRGGDK